MSMASPLQSIGVSSCLVCRSRKVKCDRTTPSCGNCIRLGVRCPGLNPDQASGEGLQASVEGIFRAAGVEKRRFGSCEQCRRAKSRCSRTRPTCRRCIQKRRVCTYLQKDTGEESQKRPRSSSNSTNVSSPLYGGAQSPEATDFKLLHDERLPSDVNLLRRLFEVYFTRVHPLRCLGFIHKPTFLQSLDRGTLREDYGEALLLIMCALAARFIFTDTFQAGQLPGPEQPLPGLQWAVAARDMAMGGLIKPSVKVLMAAILICEYFHLEEQYSTLFILTGCCCRVARLLNLDFPRPSTKILAPAEATEDEIENRVLWACFVLDNVIGSGVENNLTWNWTVPSTPLPRSESNFITQSPPSRAPPLTLENFATSGTLGSAPIQAHIVYLVYMRTKVLRLIRQTRLTKVAPEFMETVQVEISDDDSPFLGLIQEMHDWYLSLPEQLRLSDINLYVLREQNLLSSAVWLHLAYHAGVADLTRISLPGFDFPLAAAFSSASAGFKRQCQERCRFHSDEVSKIVKFGLEHDKRCFDDNFCIVAAFETIKIQIIHTATRTPPSQQIREAACDNIKANLKLLELMHLHKHSPNPMLRPLVALLMKFGFHELAAEWDHVASPSTENHDERSEVPGHATLNYLTHTVPYRRARLEIQAEMDKSVKASDAGIPQSTDSFQTRPPTILPTQRQYGDDSASLWTQSYPALSRAPSMGNTDSATEDYIRLAGEMTSYITWDAASLPSWIDFDLPA